MRTICIIVVLFKQTTAYEICECDWSSEVCSSDLIYRAPNRTYEKAVWNGEPVQEERRIQGRSKEQLILFGDEELEEGTFEIDLQVMEDEELNIGIFSSRIPKDVYISAETNPPKEWNIDNVKHLIGTLSYEKLVVKEQH